MGRRKRLQFENAERAPITAKKADYDGTVIKKIRKVNQITAPAAEPESRRHLAGLYRLSDEAGFSKCPDRTAHGTNRARFGLRLVFTTTRVKLRLQRHK